MKKNEYLVSMGGGISQLPLAKEAIKQGYKLVVIDKNNNAPCKELASIFINKSTYRFSSMLDELENIKEKIKY